MHLVHLTAFDAGQEDAALAHLSGRLPLFLAPLFLALPNPTDHCS